MLEFLKLMVQPVVLVRAEDGVIMGEQLGQAISLYSRSEISEYLDGLFAQIENDNRKEETLVSHDEE